MTDRCLSMFVVDPHLVERLVRCVHAEGHTGHHEGYHTSRGVITWSEA